MQLLINYLFVRIDGALGYMIRLALSMFLPSNLIGIPLPIMIINLLGCLIIGMLSEFMAIHWDASNNMRYLLIPGLLGGFTKFLSFGLEFGSLYQKDKFMMAFVCVISSIVVLCLFFIVAKLIRIYFTLPQS